MWSKRGTRGYPSDYDGRSHQGEESKPSDSTKDNEGAADVENEAEVEVVESRDRNHGCADTENAVGVTQVSIACVSAVARTEKDTVRSRLGELYHLLNNRKGSLSAIYIKNADANTRATI